MPTQSNNVFPISWRMPELNNNTVAPPSFNMADATKYNTKSKTILSKFQSEVNNALHNSSDWTTEQFANTVYAWQKNNGFTANKLDGKLGPLTMNKMMEVDPALKKVYQPHLFYMNANPAEQPNKKVLSLKKQLTDISTSSGIPLAMLIGWIQVESGGNNSTLTTSAGFREAGLFQISEEEGKRLGVNLDKVMTDLDYSLRMGVKLIKIHARDVDGILSNLPVMNSGIAKGSDLYWRLVMFTFSAGEGTITEALTLMNKYKFIPKTWLDLIIFVSQHPKELRKGFSATKWAAHVDRAFNIGYMAVNSLQQASPSPATAATDISAGATAAARASQEFIIKKRARSAKYKMRKFILDFFDA